MKRCCVAPALPRPSMRTGEASLAPSLGGSDPCPAVCVAGCRLANPMARVPELGCSFAIGFLSRFSPSDHLCSAITTTHIDNGPKEGK